MTSFYRRAIGALILLVSCLWLVPVQSQAESCGEGTRKIIYGAVLDGEVRDREIYSQYCIEGHAGDRMVINVETDSLDDETDVFVALTDPDFTQIYDSMQSENPVARLIVPLEEDGFYTLTIGFIKDKTEVAGRFTLTLSNTDEESVSSTSGDLGPCPVEMYNVVPGIEMRFSIDDETYFQEYCFVGQRDGLYRILVEPIDGDLDPILMIFSQSGDDIASNDNDGQHTHAAGIDFIPEQDGIYTLFVTRKGVDEGTTEGRYRLTIDDRTTSEPDSCPETFMPPSEPRLIEPAQIGDFHTYCFNGRRNHPLVLTASAQRGVLRLTTVVIDPNGEELVRESASEPTFSMTITPQDNGVHFIYVFDQTHRGGFLLSLIER